MRSLIALTVVPMLAPALAAAEPSSGVHGALTAARDRAAALAGAMTGAGPEAAAVADRWSAALASGPGVRAFAYLVVLVMVAGGLEWFYWTYARPRLTGVLARMPETRRQALALAGTAFLLRAFAAILFSLGLLAASAPFAWPPGLQEGVVVVATAVLAVRLIRAAALALLAPRNPAQRLLMVSTRNARRLATAIPLTVGAFAVLIGGAEIAERSAGALALADTLRTVAALASAALLISVARRIETFRGADRPAGRRLLPAVPLPFAASLWSAIVGLLWISGQTRWAMTLLVLSATLGAERLSRPAVAGAWRALFPPAETEVAETLRDEVLHDVALRFVRFVIGLAGLAVCAAVWDAPVFSVSSAETPAGRLAARLVGAAAVLLIADMAWAAVRGGVDRRLDAIARSGTDPETGSQARLVTLLPILRKASGVVIVTLALLSVLSVFGIEITPLLAGAGIVGIAVGFGAQTLVRDILSGFFYLLEDVFRIGDYIEGGSAKGTVERITLRSVALRHQNGPLHFVPYGALGAVRNNSRDWVIDKFEIPLPTDVDSEFVRKLVKKIGQEMAEEPAFAGIVVAPLKAKLYRIEPGVKVFRCKVQTPPGKQFEVRGEAYKRIEASLRANGLGFASNATQVVLQGGAAAQPASA